MTYDADGLRSSKTVGTRKTEYQYVGDKLFYEKRGDNQTFYYFYDSYGNLSMIRYTLVGSDNSVSTATYLTQTNSQGDVVALYKKSGELYARYEYDAWGNTLSVTDANGNEITAWYNIANANPIRYRGYYYDADLGLYYLQSRYYDSEIGRFINADGFVTTGQGVMSYNMYSYCQNNPVMFSDKNGMCSKFLGFLWKIDCKNPNCSTSRKYINRTPGFLEETLTKLTRPREDGATFSVGGSFGSTVGGNMLGKSGVLSVDSSYNYALQETTSTGVATGEGVSFGLVLTYTNASNVQDLSGYSESTGGSFVAVGGFAIDVISFNPASNPEKTCWGVSVTLSGGIEAEAHSASNDTTSTDSWNPLKSLKGYLYE